MEDRDLKQRFTREDFDALSEDLFARVTRPVEDALKMAELTPASLFTGLPRVSFYNTPSIIEAN